MRDKRLITGIAVAALIIALLFWNPTTRSVILIILPLGSGIDDLIFLAALILAVVFVAFRVIAGRKIS